MKGYLYKLKEGYVLCSDEEIQEGDTILHQRHGVSNIHKAREIVGKSIVIGQYKESSCWIDYSKKVLTQSPTLSSLSPDEQKEIGWFDAEEFAEQAFIDKFKRSPIIMGSVEADSSWLNTWANGFQKALELTADRRFTEEDMLKAMLLCTVNNWQDYSLLKTKKWADDYIQSLSQPKSWEVEYQEENGVYKILSIKNNT